jgi:transketolase
MNEETMYGVSLKGMRATLGETLVELGHRNDRLVVIDCETGTATNIVGFKHAFPDRYVTTGVAEQNGVSFAFGVARSGYLPIVPLFGAFLTKRAYDQIFIQVAYANANVKLIGCYAGLTSPNTGATHQTINDIAMMRSLPNMLVIEPADSSELRDALFAIVEYEGPVYLRMIRGDIPAYDGRVVPADHQFCLDKSTVLKEGRDVSLIGSGLMVTRCLEAAEILQKEGIEAEVVNCSAIKPLDAETILRSVRKTNRAVTAENHSIIGGVGGAVAEMLSEEHPVRLKRVGIMDKFGESAALEDLFLKYGLTSQAVVDAAKALLKAD